MSQTAKGSATTNDFKVKTRSADTSGSYLQDKLKVGTGLTITITDGDVGEKMTITIDSVVLNNYTATTDPLVTSDTDAGYSVGSIWVNTSTPEAFICVDATAGAADWDSITA